jgi:hypothetical protein
MAEQVASKFPTVDIEQERKKPRLLAILFCDYLNFTKDDKANLIGIFDRVYVHPEHKMTPQFVLFLRSVETRDEPLKVRVFNPDGKFEVEVAFDKFNASIFSTELPAHVQSTVRIQFQVSKAGVYWFDVLYQGESIGGAGLVIEYREVEERTGGTDTYT